MNNYDKIKDEAEFNKKYGVLFNEYMSKDRDVAYLIKGGGARFLTTAENKKKLAEKAVSNYTFSQNGDLEGNLEAENEFLDMMIGMMKKGLGDAQDEQFKKQQQQLQDAAIAVINSADKAVQQKIQSSFFASEYNYYIDVYSECVNGSVQQGDYQEKLQKFHDENVKSLDKMSENSDKLLQNEKASENPNKDAILMYETENVKSKISKNAAIKAYKQVLNEVKNQQNIQRAVSILVKEQCQKMVLSEYDDSNRLKAMQELRDSEAYCRRMSRIPQEIIDFFDSISAKLYKLIVGIDIDLPNLSNKNLVPKPDIEAIKKQLMNLLNPILGGFDKLSIPFPPIVKPIIDLMSNKSDGMQLDAKQLEELKKLKENFKVPTAWKDSLQTLIQTIYTTILLMPTLLIQLIFNMIDAIIKAIKQLGAPIPQPLNLITDAVELVPKIYELQRNFPQIMKQIAEDKMKELGAKMYMFGIGNVSGISDVKMPEVPSPSLECPEALKTQLEYEYLKDKEAELEKQAKEIKELQEKIKNSTDSGLVSNYKKVLQWMENTYNSMMNNEDQLKYGSEKEKEVNEKIKKIMQSQAKKYMPVKQLTDPTAVVADNPPPTTSILDSLGVNNGTTAVA